MAGFYAGGLQGARHGHYLVAQGIVGNFGSGFGKEKGRRGSRRDFYYVQQGVHFARIHQGRGTADEILISVYI
jgi:hypothetical protein